MKRMIRLCSVLCVLVIMCSCASWFETTVDPAEQLELEDERARMQLRKAYLAMEKERFYYAREVVKPMLKHPTAGREARLLLKQIEFKLQYRNIRREQELAGRVALTDVEKRLTVPETYNQTRKFIPKVGPFVLEKGPMEELLNKEVTINLQNADLAGLMAALVEIEGMNIIADEELEVARQLTMNLKNVKLRDLMSYIERNMGLRFYVTANVIWIVQGESGEDTSPTLETKIIYLKKGYIPSKTSGGGGGAAGGGHEGGGEGGGGAGEDDLYDALTMFLEDESMPRPEGAMFEIFRNRNILIIRDTRDNIRMAQRLIDAFDRDYMQVMIEARFLTVKQDDLKGLGVQINRLIKRDPNFNYDLDADPPVLPLNPDGTLLGDNIHSYTASSAIGALSDVTGTIGIGGILDKFLYDITLSLLEDKGTAKTLSAPRITVLNNHEATFVRGSTKYFHTEFESGSTTTSTGSTTTTTTGGLVPVGAPEKFEDGLQLKIRPSIGNDGKSIVLHIDLKDNAVTATFTAVTGQTDGSDEEQTTYRLPEEDKNEVKTVVTLNSGETVVLGGALKHFVEDKERKVPFFGDIPLLGWLFKSKQHVRQPEHLLVFITANIVDLDGKFKVGIEADEASREAADILESNGHDPERFLNRKAIPKSQPQELRELLDEHGLDPDDLIKDDPDAEPEK